MTENPLPLPTQRPEKAITLALRLVHAEAALAAFTSGQVDAIVDPDGRAYLLRGAQEHLRQSERQLQEIIECSADVITVLNRNGTIVSQSLSASRVLGHGPNDLVGMIFFKYVHPDDLPQFYAAFLNVIEGFRPDATVEFRHRIGDGTYRLIEATVGRLGQSSPPRVVLSMRPLTAAFKTPTGLTRANHPDLPPAVANDGPANGES